MKKALGLALVLSSTCFAAADPPAGPAWQPPGAHVQVPIWPEKPPNAAPSKEPEGSSPREHEASGKPWIAVSNVTIPTMTMYQPTGKANGAAVIVFPGGGYRVLAIDLEGTEVCDALVQHGIACIVSKYRVPFSGPHWMDHCGCDVYPKVATALQDAQRTIGLVRQHAKEWNIDSHKIGVMGFSAGGHIVANVSTHFDKRAYAAVDDADALSSRPDFGVALYAGHLNVGSDSLKMMPDIGKHITGQTPPTLILFNANDPTDPVEGSLAYFNGLVKAGVPVEMHSYATGGHGFGVRRTGERASEWVDTLLMPWLRSIHILD